MSGREGEVPLRVAAAELVDQVGPQLAAGEDALERALGDVAQLLVRVESLLALGHAPVHVRQQLEEVDAFRLDLEAHATSLLH